MVSNIPLQKGFFKECPKLKMLSVAFTGVDHVDLDECRRRRIVVCNAAGYSTQAVAELAIGMMIAVYRKIVGGRFHYSYFGKQARFFRKRIRRGKQ